MSSVTADVEWHAKVGLEQLTLDVERRLDQALAEYHIVCYRLAQTEQAHGHRPAGGRTSPMEILLSLHADSENDARLRIRLALSKAVGAYALLSLRSTQRNRARRRDL